MREINLTFSTFGDRTLPIGQQGENLALQIKIDCTDVLEEYTNAYPALTLVSPNNVQYPGDVWVQEGIVLWQVRTIDTNVAGRGTARLDIVDSTGTVVRTALANTVVQATITPGEAPSQIDDWLDASSATLLAVNQALLNIDTAIEGVDRAENDREAAEAIRVSNEDNRIGTEAIRVSNETDRVSAEALRVSAETGRADAEALRVSAETGRASAEAQRASAEADRSAAEAQRQAAISDFIDTTSANKKDAEAYALGTRDGVSVENTDPTYHNNSKYYAELAAGSANQAFEYRNSAYNTVTTAIVGIQDEANTQRVSIVETGTTQVGNVNNAGLTQVGAVGEAGTTQVSAVEAVGAAQVTAVQNKGEEVVDEIEASYGTLVADVNELESVVNAISEVAENLFDSSYLLTATNWAYDSVEGSYYGDYRYIGGKFGSNTNGYPISFDSGVQYKLSGTYKVSGDTTTGNGVSFRFLYTDTTTSEIKLANSTSEFTDFEVTSQPGKTVEKLFINYATGPSNIIYLKNMAVYPNDVIPATAKDLVARANISAQDNRIDVIEDNIDAIKSNAYISVVADTPLGFTWKDSPISGKILDDFRGNVKVDFDVSSYDPSENGVTYYVDAVNGDDSNDGLTPLTALAKISTAYAKPDVSCIILKAGIYIAVKNLSQQIIGKSIAIKGEPGKDVYICQTSLTTLSAVSGYSGVYSGTRGNCSGVMDLKNKNADGDGILYTNASTLEDVQTTEGTWILTGGSIYIHTIDGRVPDADLLLFRSGDNIVAEGSLTLYLENLKVYGGNSPLRATATAASDHLRVFAKDCEFYYSYTDDNDAVMMQGAEIAIFQNCSAKYAKKDGFNYHMAQNILPKAIEIGCVGAYNGNTEDNNDQGSTIHDGGSAIRVNGVYHDNIGSNVADQGTDTEAWMLGCVAYKSLAEGGQNSNYFTYDDVHHWLQSCVGFGSTTNVYKHNADSIVALRNCRFEGKLAIDGQEVEYY